MATPEHIQADEILSVDRVAHTSHPDPVFKKENTPDNKTAVDLMNPTTGACLPARSITANEPAAVSDPERGTKVKNGRAKRRSSNPDQLDWFDICLPIVLIVLVVICFVYISVLGSVSMLVGNSILRAANVEHTTDDGSAAAIGAIGAIIAFVALLVCSPIALNLAFCILPWHQLDQLRWNVHNAASKKILMAVGFTSFAMLTLGGTIGCTVILSRHVDVGPIDVLHAAYAGALGGAIIGPLGIIPIGKAVLDRLPRRRQRHHP